MRRAPEEFIKGPKPTRDKLNQIVRAVRENMIIPGLGLRIRETDRGVLLTLDDKILIASGLANSGQLGRGLSNGGQPFGGGGELDDFVPPNSDPTPPSLDPQPNFPEGVEPPTDVQQPGESYPPLMWATFVLPDAELDAGYAAELFAVGGTGTYSYAVTGGALPPGLSLSGNIISGTATSLGNYSVQITVTSGDQSKPNNFSIMVAATGAVRIVGNNQIGPLYWLEPVTQSMTLSVVGGTPPYSVFFTNGTLSDYFNPLFSAPNIARPPSMTVFPENTIFGDGISVTLSIKALYQERLTVTFGSNLGDRTANTQTLNYSPQGPRTMTMWAFDSTGASFSRPLIADFLWDFSKYTAVATGPTIGFSYPYPRWILTSSYNANPELYTLFTGTYPFV